MAVAVAVSGCLSPWELSGPWACTDAGTCPQGSTCDDGVCCRPGDAPLLCPTLPAPGGRCADGGPARLYFEDGDGDGEGNPRLASLRCRAPAGRPTSLSGGDCDDADPTVRPGGTEACNGRDDTCEGDIDEGLTPRQRYHLDADGDGAGQDADAVEACAAPPGHVLARGDCAPFDPAKGPGAPESCNGVDDDCDGVPDAAEDPTAFVDVDGPGRPFPCVTPAQGACRPGTFRCLATADGGVVRVCVPALAPGREVCDLVDNDCDGATDEPPDCGGPPSLVGAPGSTVEARRLTSTATLNLRCQSAEPGVVEGASPDGTWSGSGGGFHVWSLRAPPSAPWDLSNPSATLAVELTAAASGFTGPRGAFGDPTGALDGGRDSVNPVVYLCGDTPDQVMRYRLARPADGLQGTDPRFSSHLVLRAVGSDWLVGQGSGFDTSRVRSVELVVQVMPGTTFTITLSPDAGFRR